MDRFGVHTKTEAVDLALRHLAGQPMSREEAPGHAGRSCHRGDCAGLRSVAVSVILADTSAWVEYDRATRSRVDRRLTELIEDGADLAVTEPVIMEVVAGARDDAREHDLRRLLQCFDLLRFDPAVDFDAAVRIHRSCRRQGFTPRGMVDCLIASVAHRHGARLLARDVALVRVARVVGISLDDSSR